MTAVDTAELVYVANIKACIAIAINHLISQQLAELLEPSTRGLSLLRDRLCSAEDHYNTGGKIPRGRVWEPAFFHFHSTSTLVTPSSTEQVRTALCDSPRPSFKHHPLLRNLVRNPSPKRMYGLWGTNQFSEWVYSFHFLRPKLLRCMETFM